MNQNTFIVTHRLTALYFERFICHKPVFTSQRDKAHPFVMFSTAAEVAVRCNVDHFEVAEEIECTGEVQALRLPFEDTQAQPLANVLEQIARARENGDRAIGVGRTRMTMRQAC